MEDEDATPDDAILDDRTPEQAPGEPTGDGDTDADADDGEVRAAGDEFGDNRSAPVGGETAPGSARESRNPDTRTGTGGESARGDEPDTGEDPPESSQPRGDRDHAREPRSEDASEGTEVGTRGEQQRRRTDRDARTRETPGVEPDSGRVSEAEARMNRFEEWRHRKRARQAGETPTDRRMERLRRRRAKRRIPDTPHRSLHDFRDN